MKHLSFRSSAPGFALLLLTACGVLVACSSGSGSGSGSGGSCGNVEGDYAVDEKFAGTCPSTIPITDALSVTVTGSTAKLTNGTNFLVHCTLSGCDCTTASGNLYTFSATGFTEVETESGCTTTTTGTKTTPGTNGDGQPTPGTDGGADAKVVGSSRTKLGQSCEKADLPSASSTCTIPGTYGVTEYLCSSPDPACTDVTTDTPYTWTATVTLTGSEVKLTNGTDRLLKCTLTPPCTCTSTSGAEIRFTQSGFVRLGDSSCQAGTTTQNELAIGVKQ